MTESLFFLDKVGKNHEEPNEEVAWVDKDCPSSLVLASAPSWARNSHGLFESHMILENKQAQDTSLRASNILKIPRELGLGLNLRLSNFDFHKDLVLYSSVGEKKIHILKLCESGAEKLDSGIFSKGRIIALLLFGRDSALIVNESGEVYKWKWCSEMPIILVARVPDFGRKWTKAVLSPNFGALTILGEKGKVVVFESRGWKQLLEFSINGDATSCSFGNKGLLYVGSSQRCVFIWDISLAQCVDKIEDTGGGLITQLALSSDDQLLAVGSETGVVNVYNLTQKKLVMSSDHLVTAINHISFDNSSHALLFSSMETKGAIQLIRLSSASARVFRPANSAWRIFYCGFIGSSSQTIVVDVKGKISIRNLHKEWAE